MNDIEHLYTALRSAVMANGIVMTTWLVVDKKTRMTGETWSMFTWLPNLMSDRKDMDCVHLAT